jgi:arabinofuranosyltransferase
VVTLVLLARLVPRTSWRPLAVAGGACVVLALVNPYAPLRAGPAFGLRPRVITPGGFSDERHGYFFATSLLYRRGLPSHDRFVEAFKARLDSRGVSSRGAIGFYGYYVGTAEPVIDRLALADPLLARLPPMASPRWRPGHFKRRLPLGYPRSVEKRRNSIKDPNLARYYGELSLVTSGPIWSKERFAAIWRLNAGKLDHLIDRAFYAAPE